jgi:hypothetical protein
VRVAIRDPTHREAQLGSASAAPLNENWDVVVARPFVRLNLPCQDSRLR